MPRRNQPRTVGSEQALARRIAHERESRGWSNEGLASRMTRAGCSMAASAIFKIENSGRRITVDELVAFSQVLGLPLDELLLPPELADRKALTELLVDWEVARRAAVEAADDEKAAWEALKRFTSDNAVDDVLEKALRGWVDHYFEEPDREAALAVKMVQLTGSEKWLEAWRAETESDD